MRLILASVSPRRRELLQKCGIDCEVRSADIEETRCSGETPDAMALRLARGKARFASQDLKGSEAWILAADTVVADGNEILGKPRDAGMAGEFLRRLRGREHQVITGVCLLQSPSGKEFTAVETTGVRMREYSAAEMEAYRASGDGMDKAGAYAIQDPAFRPVESIAGCYTNVVGFPLCRVYDLLERTGWKPVRPLPKTCRSGGKCGLAAGEFPHP